PPPFPSPAISITPPLSNILSIYLLSLFSFFFFHDTATTEIYTLSLHDALPISGGKCWPSSRVRSGPCVLYRRSSACQSSSSTSADRKSTRLNSSHVKISYAVFCLKKKKKNIILIPHIKLLLFKTETTSML